MHILNCTKITASATIDYPVKSRYGSDPSIVRTRNSGAYLLDTVVVEGGVNKPLVSVDVVDNIATLQYSDGSIESRSTRDVSDYPDTLDVMPDRGSMISGLPIKALRWTALAASTDGIRWSLQSLYIRDNEIIATDGRRIHRTTLSGRGALSAARIVPITALKFVFKTAKGDIDIRSMEGGRIELQYRDKDGILTTVLTSGCDEEYPDCEKFFKQPEDVLVALISDKTKAFLSCHKKEKSLRFGVNSLFMGSASFPILCSDRNDGVCPKYLLDAIGDSKEARVFMRPIDKHFGDSELYSITREEKGCRHEAVIMPQQMPPRVSA